MQLSRHIHHEFSSFSLSYPQFASPPGIEHPTDSAKYSQLLDFGGKHLNNLPIFKTFYQMEKDVPVQKVVALEVQIEIRTEIKRTKIKEKGV